MESEKKYCCNGHRLKKLVFGLTVILAGGLLIGFNTGMLSPAYKHIVFSWQMLLITIGIINLFSIESSVFGIILIAVGSFFILPELKILPFDSNLLWPALLIVLGLLIIFKRGHRRNVRWQHWHRRHPYWREEMKDHKTEYKFEEGYIEESNFFSGSKHTVPPGEFKGGRISSIFGGSEIDLTQTTLAEGTNILDIDCTFGGISLIVPSDWNIKVAVKAVMGGFSDKRRIIKTNGSNSELIIQGSVVFGGGEIKSA